MPRSGDAVSAALESVISRYSESVRRIAWRYGLSGDLIDESMQEVRIRLWRAFPGSHQLAALSASYMYRTAVTAALVVLRRRRSYRDRMVELTPDHDAIAVAPAASASEGLEEEELAVHLEQALNELAEARQAVVRLHLRGYHREQIAGLLGWSEAKTRNLLYRGLDDLRALLAARGVGAETDA